MSAPSEVLITSDASGQLWNSCVWDFHTGTSLMHYRGSGCSGPHSLCLLGGDYLVGGGGQKSLVNMWELQRKDQTQLKTILPGKVNCLNASPDGNYLIVGIAEKIYIWQTCTGNLLKVISRHYLDVTCLKFTDDGSHFVSSGEDNLVIAWCLAKTISSLEFTLSKPEPKHVWSGHSLPVKDVHVGAGGVRARVISSSLDQTCKLWDMSTGELLCSFVFESPITSVTMDSAEMRIFAGSTNGTIFCVNMYGQPIRTERHISNTESGTTVFKGHSSRVNCLCMSMDGTILVSGSNDCSVKLWDVHSGQCMRTLDHKGSITNAFISPTPHNILNPDSKPYLVVHQLKRHLHVYRQSGSANKDPSEDDLVDMRIRDNKRKRCENSADELPTSSSSILSNNGESKLKNLKAEIAHLKSVNEELYTYAVKEIMNKIV